MIESRPVSRRQLGIFSAALACCMAFGATSWGSHYRLPAHGLVNDVELRALKGAGIQTTKALLSAAATRTQRARLVKATAIPRDRVVTLATQCDLLRVQGVGPTVVKLLQASGIRDTGALGRSEAEGLLGAMRKANGKERLIETLPDAKTVAFWIVQAKRLKPVLQDLQ